MIARTSRLPALDARSMYLHLGWGIMLVASVSAVVLTAVAPWLSYAPRAIVQYAFQTLCHQQPERSFQVDGIPFAVCHRCFGIYAGVVLGLLARPIGRRFRRQLEERAILIVACAVLAAGLDWGLDAAGLWENTTLTRVVTGFLMGCVGGLYLALALSGTTVPSDTRSFKNERRL